VALLAIRLLLAKKGFNTPLSWGGVWDIQNSPNAKSVGILQAFSSFCKWRSGARVEKPLKNDRLDAQAGASATVSHDPRRAQSESACAWPRALMVPCPGLAGDRQLALEWDSLVGPPAFLPIWQVNGPGDGYPAVASRVLRHAAAIQLALPLRWK
jgi:hypothetical protein